MKPKPEVFVVLATNDEGMTHVICATTGAAAAKREAEKYESTQSFPGLTYKRWFDTNNKLNAYIEDHDLEDDELEEDDGELVNKYIDNTIAPEKWNDATEFYQENDADYVQIIKTTLYNR